MSRAFRLLREALPAIRGVVAFCDPVPRIDAQGRLTKPGHTGVTYRALSAAYRGMTSPRTHLATPDGWIASPRALSKIQSKTSAVPPMRCGSLRSMAVSSADSSSGARTTSSD